MMLRRRFLRPGNAPFCGKGGSAGVAAVVFAAIATCSLGLVTAQEGRLSTAPRAMGARTIGARGVVERTVAMGVKDQVSGKSKLREGARLADREGVFTQRSERYFLTIDGEPEPFAILENLTLERVATATSNQDDDQKWIVTATLTEFQGKRYLLLERAVIKTKNSGQAANDAR